LVSNNLRASPVGSGNDDQHSMRTQIENLEARLTKYEMKQTPAPPNVATPTAAPEKKR
jgi:hypothetical protein